MKLKSFISILIVAVSCVTAGAAKDPEEYHVRAILANGDTITGYVQNDIKTGLKNLFSKTGSIQQYVNISSEPKGGEKKRYSASELKEYRFTEPTEGYPDGAVRVSESINSPVMFKPLHYSRGFAWELDRRDSGSILKWEVWESTGGQNSINRLVPAVGVKFKGAPGAFIISANGSFNDIYLMVYLKKKYRALYDAWNQYYHKGADAKAHRKELVDNPSTALQFYENFLLSNPPLNDDPNK